jgi:hypothetical protein
MLTLANDYFFKKQYEDALVYYKKAFEVGLEKHNLKSLLDAAFCASQCKQYTTGRLWAETALDYEPENSRGKEILAWLLFRMAFASDQTPSPELIIKNTESLLMLDAGLTAGNLSTLAVMRSTERMLKRQNIPFITIIRWLNAAKPQLLSDKPFVKAMPDARNIELASDREKFYTLKCTVLFSGEYFSECIVACDEALNAIQAFHYDNRIWITRKKAFSMAALGMYNEAAVLYEEILGLKKAWFLNYEYARILAKIDKADDALKQLCIAMLSPGPLQMKVHVVGYLTNLLKTYENADLAKMHLALHKAIYTDQKWHKPIDYEQEADKNTIESEDPPSVRELIAELKKWWVSVAKPPAQMHSGKVTKINPGNMSGFITENNGMSYYFAVTDWTAKQSTPRFGMKVKFALAKRFNKKKGIDNDVAILVTLINE